MTTEAEQRRMPRRILVVSLDNIGDLVFASALLQPLRENFPTAHIGVWCKDGIVASFSSNHLIHPAAAIRHGDTLLCTMAHCGCGRRNGNTHSHRTRASAEQEMANADASR